MQRYRYESELPAHVRLELYREMMRLATMALNDTITTNTEEVYYLEWLVELCDERRKVAENEV